MKDIKTQKNINIPMARLMNDYFISMVVVTFFGVVQILALLAVTGQYA